jgi:hypothetical protein
VSVVRQVPVGSQLTYYDQLLELAAKAPGFAGFVADSDGSVRTIWSAPPGTPVANSGVVDVSANAARAVQTFIAAHNWRSGSGSSAGASVRAVRFDAATLILARSALENKLRDAEVAVTMSDFNEAANRVDIAVATSAQSRAVTDAALALGIPPGAVRVTVEGVARPFQTLRDNVEPIRGGMGVSTIAFSGFYSCTITPPISQYSGPFSPIYDDVVLTASHCTSALGGLGPSGGDSIYQNSRYIGRETSDSPVFSGGSCPKRAICRWADVAVITVGSQFSPDLPWRLNTIANTGSSHGVTAEPYPITIVDQDTVVSMSSAYLPIGATVRKQGARSGTTSGSVTQSCVNRPIAEPGGPQITFLCTYTVNAHAGQGDSGAPVYSWVANPPWLGGNATIRGILIGGSGNPSGPSFYFSPVQNILYEAPYLFDR